jgi:hypothetical protein
MNLAHYSIQDIFCYEIITRYLGNLQFFNLFKILVTGQLAAQLTTVYSLIFLSIFLEPTKGYYFPLGRVFYPVLPMLS